MIMKETREGSVQALKRELNLGSCHAYFEEWDTNALCEAHFELKIMLAMNLGG